MNPRCKNFLLFFFFFLSTAALYSNTIHSKFVFDFIDLVFDFQKRGWADLGSFSSGFSPYWVAKGSFFVVLNVFHFNVYGWFIVTCALHALNTFLLFLFVRNILRHFNQRYDFVAAICSAILFLVSPYHTEVIVWGGAFNYLIVSFFVLLHLNAIISLIRFDKTSSVVIALLSFFAASFSHEWGLFLIPADMVILIFLTPGLMLISRRKVLILVGLTVTITGCYLINQLLRGQLIGHYGAETHLNFKLEEIVPAFYKYLFKLLFFSAFFGAFQTRIYTFIQLPIILYTLVFVLLVFFISLTYVVLRKRKTSGIAVSFLLLFILFVFPVLNLYFPFWIRIHADRYCYLPSAFLYAGCVVLLFQSKGIAKIILPFVFLIFSISFLLRTNSDWDSAGKLQQQLERSFRWWEAPQVYILNLPDSFRGAYMYRNIRPSKFAGSFIKYNFSVPITNITEVLSYNLNSIADSVIVEKLKDNQLKVTLSKPDIWLWKNTMGATDYEDEKVKVDIDEFNHSYVVEFKERNEGDVYLYQANGQWRELKFF